jgi:glycosyltransferase involved in cell wall biosynthesis
MSAPELSVVVASVNGFPYLGACLDSLRESCPDAEVIVADSTDAETRRRVHEEWPDVRLLSFDEPTPIPALRAAGIDAASAPYIAVIEDHCVARDGWAASLLAAHRKGRHVVGGPVRNAGPGRLRDWAAFLFEYSAFMEHKPAGAVESLTGMNVSYDRHAVAAIEDLLRDGKWENWLHARLRERGLELYFDSGAILEHAKDFGIGEFVSQRFHYSRAYAAMRNPELGWRRVVYLGGTPLLVPLLYARVARNVLPRSGGRRMLAKTTPLLLLYVTTTAVGEATGYALGGGASLLKVR